LAISSGVLQILTPPLSPLERVPLPLPPACTYDLRISPPVGSSVLAIFLASSGF